jgi:hypothetical protein
MELGDIVYIVPNGRGAEGPHCAKVAYCSDKHFMAGDYTFVRNFPTNTPRDCVLGAHPRALAYVSMEAYAAWQVKVAAWKNFQYLVGRESSVPKGVTVEHIEKFIKLMKGKK